MSQWYQRKQPIHIPFALCCSENVLIQGGPSDSLITKSLKGIQSGEGRGVYLYLLNVFCSLGLWVGSCSSSIIKWEKQSREDGNHAVAEQDIYWIKLVWHHLLTGDFACKIIKIQLNCRDLQMKDGNRWIIWHFHGFMT